MKRWGIRISLLAAGLVGLANPGLAMARTAGSPHASGHSVRDSDGFTDSFASEPWLHPPIIYTSGQDPDPVKSGYIFTNVAHSIQTGPMIISPRGQLVFYQPLPATNGATYDVNVQPYQGHTVLTYTTGTTDVMLNHNYQVVGQVTAGNGYTLGIHEFQITPEGTALITVDKHVPWNLSSIGGPANGTLIDDAIQEINIATGQVLWQWDADQHVSIKASYAGKPTSKPYDFFHINSIQQLPGGNLLISSRHTWALYKIDKATGNVLWTLGGKYSNFKMGPGASFSWQHDARMHPDGTITLFDDGAGLYQSEPQSRALRIRLDYKHHRATLVHAYTNNPSLLSWAEGNVQTLADGNTFVGFGTTPYLTEFSAVGKQLFSVHFDKPLQIYRGYRYQWWGDPTWPPSIATGTLHHGTWVWASWNGSTQVVYWRVLAGASATSLRAIGTFPKLDFETQMRVASTQHYFAVQALNSKHRLLATSQVVGR
jgi:hypothetical protein